MFFPQPRDPFFVKLPALRDRSKRRCIRIARTLALENNVTDGAHTAGELLATLGIRGKPRATGHECERGECGRENRALCRLWHGERRYLCARY